MSKLTLHRITNEQVATVARLNQLSTHYWTVDAGPLPLPATELCVNDTGHGWGTCYAPDLDGACPDCAEQYLSWVLVAGAHVAIDVLQGKGDPR